MAAILLLGNSETVGNFDSQFEVISKPERLFRHVGRARPGDFSFSIGGGVRSPPMAGQGQRPSRQAALADLCRRLVIENYAPAAVLINRKFECLYSLGPTDRYLRVAPGHPTQDLLAMARPNIRTKLRSAIQQAGKDKALIVVAGGETVRDGDAHSFNIAVQPVLFDGNDLFLICFIDAPKQQKRSEYPRCTGRRIARRQNSNRNSRQPERNFRQLSGTWRYRAKNRRQSTRTRYRTTRSSSRPTKSFEPRRKNCSH